MEQFEIVFIGLLIILQIGVFFSVRKRISAFKHFFPNTFKHIEINKFLISKEVLKNSELFGKFIDNIGTDEMKNIDVVGDESEEVELLVVPPIVKKSNSEFNGVVNSTNAYLCKNKGASADFNILQNICERHLQKLENEVSNLINVPLYIGLAGTFLGIIVGLFGIHVSDTGVISKEGISQLLNGVILAMVASLVGLGFTVWNSALNYKPAAYKNDSDKIQYYDFLQRELLPILNIGMAGNLLSFKDILSHFIIKFGENMDDYKESGKLLHDNLKTQQFVLEEINKLSLVAMANKITQTFSKLNEASEHLETFKEHQKSLSENVLKTDKLVQDINLTIKEFKDFNTNLKAISNTTITAIELQKQFKDSLELHFPVIEDHRVIWRKQVDELNSDIKGVYSQLNEFFKNSTQQIHGFVDSNRDFYTVINDMQNIMKAFVENSTLQKSEFEILRKEMVGLRSDFKDAQSQSIETNKELISAIKSFNFNLLKLSEKE